MLCLWLSLPMPGWRILQALMSCQLSEVFSARACQSPPTCHLYRMMHLLGPPCLRLGDRCLTTMPPGASLCSGYLHSPQSPESLPGQQESSCLCPAQDDPSPLSPLPVAGRRAGLNGIHCRVSLLCNLHCAMVAAFSMLPLQNRLHMSGSFPGTNILQYI